MGNKWLARFFLEKENLLGHGNIENIDISFDLLTEKGERSTVDTSYAILVKPKSELPEPKNESLAEDLRLSKQKKEELLGQDLESQSKFDYIDDETLRKIYETIHAINEFEKKSKELRNMKFAKRDKSI